MGNERLVETNDQATRQLLTANVDREQLQTEEWRDHMDIPKILGFVGTGLVAVAYIPQIRHLTKEHCSAGISVGAYVLWFMASVFFLIHAAMIFDAVFIAVQLVNLVAIYIIVISARRYEKQVCETHLAIMPKGSKGE